MYYSRVRVRKLVVRGEICITVDSRRGKYVLQDSRRGKYVLQ